MVILIYIFPIKSPSQKSRASSSALAWYSTNLLSVLDLDIFCLNFSLHLKPPPPEIPAPRLSHIYYSTLILLHILLILFNIPKSS